MATWDILRGRVQQAAPVSAEKFSVAEIMLPDHLLLRVVSPGSHKLANWPAYKFGVETVLGAHGLEEHLAATSIDDLSHHMTQVGAEQWVADEELCKAIIGFNVKDFTEVFGKSSLSEKSAGEIWQWLSGLPKAPARVGMVEGGGECKTQ